MGIPTQHTGSKLATVPRRVLETPKRYKSLPYILMKGGGEEASFHIHTFLQECGTANGYRLSVYESGYVGCFADSSDRGKLKWK